ncbi:MAG TPA: hypothetical protein VH796_13360 [Nitrososphaeraceae archaeon]|jgi:hypothetical protein
MSDRRTKARPMDRDIALTRTDLYETVEKNAKEHGVTMVEFTDMLLKRQIAPSEFFKDVI